MEAFKLDRNLAHLAVLQRIELTTSFQKKIRKLFGRYLFSKVFSKYMLDLDKISKDYYKIMYNEYLTIKKFIKPNQNILSIGAGIGGLEVIIYNSFKNENFNLITSLYSLDFHYDFEIYKKYLSSVSNNETIIIFDTIRSNYFKDIFEDLIIIKEDEDTLHKSKRIACRKFKK